MRVTFPGKAAGNDFFAITLDHVPRQGKKVCVSVSVGVFWRTKHSVWGDRRVGLAKAEIRGGLSGAHVCSTSPLEVVSRHPEEYETESTAEGTTELGLNRGLSVGRKRTRTQRDKVRGERQRAETEFFEWYHGATAGWVIGPDPGRGLLHGRWYYEIDIAMDKGATSAQGSLASRLADHYEVQNADGTPVGFFGRLFRKRVLKEFASGDVSAELGLDSGKRARHGA